MILSPSKTGTTKLPGVHDPDSIVTLTIVLRPPVWQSGVVYSYRNATDASVVIPSTFKGFYYQVVNPGVSGATEPDWAKEIGAITTDYEAGETSGLEWIAKANNLLTPDIDITTVTSSATNGVPISHVVVGGIIYPTIGVIPADAAARTTKRFKFTLAVAYSDGDKDDITFERVVGEK